MDYHNYVLYRWVDAAVSLALFALLVFGGSITASIRQLRRIRRDRKKYYEQIENDKKTT